jgi:hypothetical protein
MAKFVGLVSAVIIGLLAAQAEPITATIGYIWAALHLAAVAKNWYENRD